MAEITDRINSVAASFINEVSTLIPVARAYIFGSYAKGSPRDDSDLDIAVFTDNFYGKKSIELLRILYKVARNYSSICIEPIILEEADIEADNPFAMEVLQTGREIPRITALH